jgi:hypothetical protein
MVQIQVAEDLILSIELKLEASYGKTSKFSFDRLVVGHDEPHTAVGYAAGNGTSPTSSCGYPERPKVTNTNVRAGKAAHP